jgi:hypothetical protein
MTTASAQSEVFVLYKEGKTSFHTILKFKFLSRFHAIEKRENQMLATSIAQNFE